MRSTIEIDEKLLEQAMRLTQSRTKRDVVNLALHELVRRKAHEHLISKIGTDCLTLTPGELERLRELD